MDNQKLEKNTSKINCISLGITNYLKYNYYNLTDSEISIDHTWNTNECPAAKGSTYTYEKTTELIENDTNNYTEGYTSFDSVFGKYAPLTGSINPNIHLSGSEQTENVSSKTIEPDSILNETEDNLHISSNTFSYIIARLLEDPMASVEIIFVIVLIIAVVRRLF